MNLNHDVAQAATEDDGGWKVEHEKARFSLCQRGLIDSFPSETLTLFDCSVATV
jgi:hypothetical protein